MVWRRIMPPISRVYLKFFKVLESPSFAGRSSYDEWMTSLALFLVISRFHPVWTWDKFCGWCIWRFVCISQNLSSPDKPSAFAKCWWVSNFVTGVKRPKDLQFGGQNVTINTRLISLTHTSWDKWLNGYSSSKPWWTSTFPITWRHKTFS